MSIPDSPTYSPSETSEVPTVPLNQAETRLIHDYMTRRQHFLSDYERYNPVQNMHALANHVFDLTEGIYTMKDDLGAVKNETARTGRLIDFLNGQHQEQNGNIMGMGQDMVAMKGDIVNLRGDMEIMKGDMNFMRNDVEGLKTEVQGMKQDIDGLKTDVEGLKQDVSGLKSDVSGLKSEVSSLRSDVGMLKQDVGQLRSDVQQGFADIKAFLMASRAVQVRTAEASSPTPSLTLLPPRSIKESILATVHSSVAHVWRL